MIKIIDIDQLLEKIEKNKNKQKVLTDEEIENLLKLIEEEEL